MATATTTHRLRQAGLTGISCLLWMAAIAAMLSGLSGLVSALPLIFGLSVIAAGIGGWMRPARMSRALLLGFVIAVAGYAAMLVYVVLALTYQ